VKVRQNGRIVSVAVIVAVGVNSDRRRAVLGMDIGPSEAETFWTGFPRKLARRGLRGVKLVISDAHEGINAWPISGPSRLPELRSCRRLHGPQHVPKPGGVDTGCRANHRPADLIVIAVVPREDAAAIVPSWRSSVTTGTNSGALSAGKLSNPARAELAGVHARGG